MAAILVVVAAGCTSKEERASENSRGTGAAGWSAGAEKVQIGLIAPMTGPFAVLGVSQQNSMQIVAEQINAAGGIGGANVEIVTRDVGIDPAKAVAAATELAGDQRIKLVVGPSITSFYDATKKIYEQNEKVNCQPAVAGGTFENLTYGFRSQDRITDDVERTLQYLKSKNVTTIGEIYEGDDTGKEVNSLLSSMGPKYGVQLVGYEQTRKDDQTHLPYVQKLANAEAIWISSNVSGAKTMAAAAEAGYKGVLVGGSGIQNISFLEAAGDSAVGTVFAAPNYEFPIRDRATWKAGYKTHIEAIEAKYGVNTGPKTGAKSPKGTAIAADCMYAYWKAADAAKSLDPTKVATALTNISLSDTETPSGCAITPGKAHEFYALPCIRSYEWQKDGQGWFTSDVTPR
ncbi:ABC transporter substrate-binding protein [Saccharopolyspora pogona]|uniref:ABC transporter substrate-binding protein n=1 Tax=Saccharopolyspora pogona TaxID=333966 RepID=UPI001684021C|nr:ABC transporter substrate-binding protein [Saccharopolyspora pogona]